MNSPERTCIACRRKGEKGELVKLAYGPAGVVVDYNEKLPGRGAYVCPDRECIDKGLNEKALSRSFKHRAIPPDAGEFYSELKTKIEKKIAALLGMSRKSGMVAQGFDAAVEASKKIKGGLFILAGDISGNTAQRLSRQTAEVPCRTAVYQDKEAIGGILGGRPVAVLFISDGGLADALHREIGRLNQIYRG